MKKDRIDQLLVKKGLFETRSKAQAALMAGIIYVDGQKIEKAGTLVDRDVSCEVRGEKLPFVGRGGLKLEHALNKFKIDVENKIAIDVGASTGGFTDCLLQRGIKKVYAIDVGYGQIAWKIRQNPKVVVVERTNARTLEPDKLYGKSQKADLAVIDVSFISLSKIFPAVYNLLTDDGEIVALVKPQFEAGRKQVERGGLVKDENVRAEILEKVVKSAREIGFKFKEATFSPIKGADGNVEFLIYLSKIGTDSDKKACEVLN